MKKRAKQYDRSNAFKTASDENIRAILEKFYRFELREDEKIIDNSDETIANELGMHLYTVSNIIAGHLKAKFKKINNKLYIW